MFFLRRSGATTKAAAISLLRSSVRVMWLNMFCPYIYIIFWGYTLSFYDKYLGASSAHAVRGGRISCLDPHKKMGETFPRFDLSCKLSFQAGSTTQSLSRSLPPSEGQ
jgi:hypothetical protein